MYKAQLKPSDKAIIKLYTDREHDIYNAGFKDAKERNKTIFKFVPDTKPIHNEAIYEIVVNNVCEWFKIKKLELFSGIRSQYLVLPRSMAINLLKECTEFSYPQLAKLTTKDHTSLIYHVTLRINKKHYWKENNNHAIFNKLKEKIRNEAC